MQIYSTRPIFKSKTPEYDIWIGLGIMSLRTSEGSFSSEANVIVVRVTEQCCDRVSHWCLFEGQRVLITEKLYHMLSKIYCARAREVRLNVDFKSVEGFELDLAVG